MGVFDGTAPAVASSPFLTFFLDSHSHKKTHGSACTLFSIWQVKYVKREQVSYRNGRNTIPRRPRPNS